MGQCAPALPLHDSQISIEEKDISYIRTPQGAIGCHDGMPLQKAFFHNYDDNNTKKYMPNSCLHEKYVNKSDETQQSDFIQVHQPDIPQRCIVDQCEIKRAVWLQSDEILRRQGLLKMHGVFTDEFKKEDSSPIHDTVAIDVENDRGNDRKSMRSEPSTTFAMRSERSIASAITSTSTSTIVTANTKKIFEINKEKRSGIIGSSRIDHSYTESSLSPSLSNNSMNEAMNSFTSNDDLKMSVSYEMRPIREQPNQKPLNGNKSDLSGQRPMFRYSIQTDSERHECMSMLRLKMKAKVGWFYTQRYLSVFPNELKSIIRMVPKNGGGIPELTCESFDGSFSSNYSSDSSTQMSSNTLKFNQTLHPITQVKCPVTNEPLLDLAITGSLGLVPRDQDHNALRSSRRQLRRNYERNPNHCIVLIDNKSGSPLAVCALKEIFDSTVVTIYYTRQIAFAQKPTTTTQRLGLDWVDDLPLYTYAEVTSQGDFPDKMNFTVFVTNRFDGSLSSQPSYMAYLGGQAMNDNATIRSAVMKMVGRTASERSMSGCALIWIQSDEVMTGGRRENFSDLSFHINLARGIDPAFLICFTAIVDEILEKSMRIRYKNKIVGRERKDSFSLTKNRLEARARVAIEKQVTSVPCQVD
eukprot:CAMPEP_0197190022 /NCGR_PEP_ID=MMETSP1423-20130617/20842_1 /TAXON_ID=476441 /ORGANISM="Pseudo-nitzschia heimii, Strain UNC1101" /LENGTH=638 /DNA_ID=CAMNT_0042642301 /DNA_START=163 /DNA_END=2076 /DNA_ORIENTATION=-